MGSVLNRVRSHVVLDDAHMHMCVRESALERETETERAMRTKIVILVEVPECGQLLHAHASALRHALPRERIVDRLDTPVVHLPGVHLGIFAVIFV